jgi:hypothetical protein
MGLPGAKQVALAQYSLTRTKGFTTFGTTANSLQQDFRIAVFK